MSGSPDGLSGLLESPAHGGEFPASVDVGAEHAGFQRRVIIAFDWIALQIE